MLLGIPLLIFSFIAYNILTFVTEVDWSSEVMALDMVSGEHWVLTVADLFIASSLVLLFFEILKATRTGRESIIDHGLSTLVFIACLIEFLIIKEAATSVFFLMTVITLIDVVAGFSVSIVSARRDFAVDHFPTGGS